MAGFDYGKSAATAERLLAKFGQRGAIRVQGERSDWDDGPAAVTDHPCTMAVLPIDLQSTGYDVAGTLIKAGDVKVLVSTVGLTIRPTTVNSIVTAKGEVYSIVRVIALEPAGVPVIFDIIGRR